LVGKAVNNVLVVIDTTVCSFVNTGLLWLLEGRDIPDIRHRVTVLCGTCSILLINLVIKNEKALVEGVEDPSLVSIASSGVRCSGDNLGCFLVGYVVDGKGIFIVTIADIFTIVFGIWSTVYDTLGLKVICQS